MALAGLSILSMLLVLGLPVLVIVVIVLAIVKNKNSESSEEGFEIKIRTLYLYFILIITLGVTIISMIMGISGVADIIFPTDYTYYDDTEEQKYNRKIAKTKEVIDAFVIAGVAIPTFIIHRKKVEELKENDVINEQTRTKKN